MFKIKSACAALAAALTLVVSVGAAANPFSVKSVLGSAPEQKNCLTSVAVGEVLDFSAADFERRMELEPGSLKGVTITDVPSPVLGGLFLDGVEVNSYDFLERSALDRLCFAASENEGNAVVRLLPQAKNGVSTNLSIRVVSTPNRPPEAESLSLRTGRNIPLGGYLQANDPDGDSIRIQVVTPPKKGEVVFYGASFTYEPYHNKTGADSFSVCAIDSLGAYSAEAVVNILIDDQKRDFYYTDMVIHPSQYAALMLQEAGVYTGERMGSSYFFRPDDKMDRGRFLMLLISASGLAESMTPTVNTGLPGDEAIPVHLKRYIKKAVEEKIISGDIAFRWNEIPSRAEAVVLTSRAAKIGDVGSYPLSMHDAMRIPEWGLSAYRKMAAYKMLDLYDGYAYPDAALTNAYAADLSWQLYKRAHPDSK